MIGEKWMDLALCTQTDPDMFFPIKGSAGTDAKRVCANCDVAKQCLAYAFRNGEREGVWGGVSIENYRRRMRAQAA